MSRPAITLSTTSIGVARSQPHPVNSFCLPPYLGALWHKRRGIMSTGYPVPMNLLFKNGAPKVHFAVGMLAIIAVIGQIGWAQSSLPPGQTIHVDTQLVLLDALVENKKTGLTV